MTLKQSLKKKTLRGAAAVVVGLSTLLGGSSCKQESQKDYRDPPADEKKVLVLDKRDTQTDHIDALYKIMRGFPCNMTRIPYLDEKGDVYFGFGTPLTPEVMPQLQFAREGGKGALVKPEARENGLREIRDFGFQKDDRERLGVTDASIRTATKNHMRAREGTLKELLPNYDSSPNEIKALLLYMDIQLKGKIHTYPRFLNLVNAGKYKEAAGEAGIRELRRKIRNENGSWRVMALSPHAPAGEVIKEILLAHENADMKRIVNNRLNDQHSR